MTTIDMRNTKKIVNPSKATNNIYKKVTIVSGNTETVLWKGTWKYTIYIGNYVTSIRYKINNGAWVVHQKSTSASLMLEIDSGATLDIEAYEYTSESSTYQYTYTMTDYNFNISRTEANNGGEVTLYRTASAVDRYYTITWKNYDGSVLKTDTVIHDGTPSYSGSTPTKAADNTYTYSFSSWSPSIAIVTGDATYTAQFSESYINYTITWKWQSSYGSWTTTTETYHYNDTPSRALPSDVTSGNNKQVCTGWDSLANVTASRTIEATYQQQYYIEINRVRCTCPSSDGWYNAGESITFTANSNCAFNSNGTQTTYSPTINSGGTYTGSADFVYCTTSGTNCSANKSGWMAYGETITWTADSHYHFGNSNSTTTTTDSAIADSLSKTANINYYWVYIYNDNSGYDINCGSNVIPADDFIAYGSYAYGTSVTIPSCTPQVSPYTASGSKTITVTSDVSLHLNTRYQPAGMVDTQQIDYVAVTYNSPTYRGGPGSCIWGDYGNYNLLSRPANATHIQLVWNGTTYIAPIPSDVETMGYYYGYDDNFGPYNSTCIVGSGTISWTMLCYSDDEDTSVEVYITLKNKGSSSNYNNFTKSSCVYGRYVSASYICYWE